MYKSIQMTWSQAETFCQSLNSHLVSIVSQTEQDEIYLMTNRNPDTENASVWLGMTGTQVRDAELQMTESYSKQEAFIERRHLHVCDHDFVEVLKKC